MSLLTIAHVWKSSPWKRGRAGSVERRTSPRHRAGVASDGVEDGNDNATQARRKILISTQTIAMDAPLRSVSPRVCISRTNSFMEWCVFSVFGPGRHSTACVDHRAQTRARIPPA